MSAARDRERFGTPRACSPHYRLQPAADYRLENHLKNKENACFIRPEDVLSCAPHDGFDGRKHGRHQSSVSGLTDID
jgi:hypothetical protein